jgi:hypothetical protein
MPKPLRACLPAVGFGPRHAPKAMPNHQMIPDGLSDVRSNILKSYSVFPVAVKPTMVRFGSESVASCNSLNATATNLSCKDV